MVDPDLSCESTFKLNTSVKKYKELHMCKPKNVMMSTKYVIATVKLDLTRTWAHVNHAVLKLWSATCMVFTIKIEVIQV